MSPIISNPIAKNITPTFGWYHSHAREKATIHNGIQTSNAATKMINPTVPLRMPPTKGMKPKIVVIGEKNIQIPITIIKYERTRKTQVNILDFYTAFLTISDLLMIYSSTRSIYSIGLSKSAMQLEMQQHAGSSFVYIFPFP